MRFQLAHKLVTYFLMLSTLAALAGTHALSPVSACLFIAACALSFGVDAGNRFAVALDRASNVLRLAALAVGAALLWRIWRHLPDPDYGPGFDLGLGLLAYKLFYRRTHRDYIHLLAFSFLLVLVASTLAASFAFVAAFAVYVAFAVWGLILFHLRREMEENYLVKHSAQAPSQKVGVGRILGSRRVVGLAFFVATAGVTAAVLAGAIAIFMFVPRFGAGFLLGGTPGSSNVVAAGDEIQLGRYGTTATAGHAVVLRATVPAIAALPGDAARRQAADGLYFRGATYDVYEHGHWARSRIPPLGTVVVEDGGGGGARRFWVHEPSEGWPPPLPQGEASAGQEIEAAARRDLAGAIRQEIEAVGIPASVLFAIDRAVALELPATRLGAAGELRVLPRWSGETALRVGAGAGAGGDGFITLAHAHYVAYSSPRPEASAARLPADGELHPVLAPAARSAYLALPPALQRRFGAVAEEIATRAIDLPSSEAGRIASVVDWLRAGHAYSPLPPPAAASADPVEDFVFTQPRGHCELFASAAVLLLRAGGIPARYVTGFRGGDWNGLGGYIAFRDDRAHAWAEAFLPDTGWVRVDATPPGALPPRAGRLAEVADSLDYYWSRWVVGYDLPRQRDLAHRAGRRLAPLGSGASWRHPATVAGLLGVLVALAALGLAAGRAWRRWTRAGEARPAAARGKPPAWANPPTGAIGRLYRRTVRRLGRGGWTRRPNETPREYARRLRRSGMDPSGAFDLLTERYTAARFGGHGADAEVVADLAAKLAAGARVGGHPGSGEPDARA